MFGLEVIRGHSHSTYARRRGGGGRQKAYVCVRGGRGVLLDQVRTRMQKKYLHFFKSLNGLKSATLHKNMIKITLFIMNIFYYKTNLIHFRETKLLRVGLKFTKVSFARVRPI